MARNTEKRMERERGFGNRQFGYQMARRPARFSLSKHRIINTCYGVGLAACLAAIGHASYSYLMETVSLSNLQIEGVPQAVAEDVRTTIKNTVGDRPSLLRLDMPGLAHVLTSHPRIQNVWFERRYPDTLIVRASERQPAAIVSADDFYLIGQDGFVIQKIKYSTARDYTLPYITGLSDEVVPGEKILNPQLTRALDLCRVLKERNANLYSRFSEVHLGTDSVSHLENLTAKLKGGVEVRFGDRNPVEKLPQLEFFIQLQQEQGVDPFSMSYVDLRFNNQIVFMDVPTDFALYTGRYQQGTEDPTRAIQDMTRNNEQAHNDSQASQPAASPETKRKQEHQTEGKQQTAKSTQPKRATPPATTVGSQTYVTSRAPAPEPQPEQVVEQPKRGLSRFKFWKREPDVQPSGRLYAPPDSQ